MTLYSAGESRVYLYDTSIYRIAAKCTPPLCAMSRYCLANFTVQVAAASHSNFLKLLHPFYVFICLPNSRAWVVSCEREGSYTHGLTLEGKKGEKSDEKKEIEQKERGSRSLNESASMRDKTDDDWNREGKTDVSSKSVEYVVVRWFRLFMLYRRRVVDKEKMDLKDIEKREGMRTDDVDGWPTRRPRVVYRAQHFYVQCRVH